MLILTLVQIKYKYFAPDYEDLVGILAFKLGFYSALYISIFFVIAALVIKYVKCGRLFGINWLTVKWVILLFAIPSFMLFILASLDWIIFAAIDKKIETMTAYLIFTAWLVACFVIEILYRKGITVIQNHLDSEYDKAFLDQCVEPLAEEAHV